MATGNIKRNLLTMGAWAAFALAALCFTGAIAMTVRIVPIATGEKTRGEIVDVWHTFKLLSRSTAIAPVVQFTAADGHARTFVSSIRGRERPTIGRAVSVRYDRRDPATAEIDAFEVLWLAPFCAFAGFFAFASIGFIVFRAIKKRARTPHLPST